MEVQSVTLNGVNNRGSISGTFLNSGNFRKRKTFIWKHDHNAVIGEHVVVTEFNGQQYYSTIINRKGSTNENSM